MQIAQLYFLFWEVSLRLLHMVDYKAYTGKVTDKLYGLKPYWQNDRSLFSLLRILLSIILLPAVLAWILPGIIGGVL
jgi:hypothetical protein